MLSHNVQRMTMAVNNYIIRFGLYNYCFWTGRRLVHHSFLLSFVLFVCLCVCVREVVTLMYTSAVRAVSPACADRTTLRKGDGFVSPCVERRKTYLSQVNIPLTSWPGFTDRAWIKPSLN